jgi:Bacterial aa3 type cytochrome c oxidase subunit IV
MAGDHGHEPGTMDITQHKKTWSFFVKLTTWSLILIGLLMFFLMLFRTHG